MVKDGPRHASNRLADWQYLQVIKHRSGYRLSGVTIKVVYGTEEEVLATVGAHTAYVERTNLTCRQMNGRLVRKTLSYSKQLEMLEAACAWEDWVWPLRSGRVKGNWRVSPPIDLE